VSKRTQAGILKVPLGGMPDIEKERHRQEGRNGINKES
jgi:hypothetical protein